MEMYWRWHYTWPQRSISVEFLTQIHSITRQVLVMCSSVSKQIGVYTTRHSGHICENKFYFPGGFEMWHTCHISDCHPA